ncbi:MAG: DUF167 domain-containing protein [Alphaproteobacteria bacterium]|jgi:uncharacterized protein|nr:DUF167 domain-containing protein [Alphaproteobacteria bacterium]MBT7943021.1 DUF167 domain-containing protein [Alphaproteobacteria bacterium]
MVFTSLAEGSPFAQADGGVTVIVRLTPNASANRIGPVAFDDNGDAALKVAVTEIPEDGKANRALIKLLAKSWGLPKTSISLKRGQTNRLKTLFIEDRAANERPGELYQRLTEEI